MRECAESSGAHENCEIASATLKDQKAITKSLCGNKPEDQSEKNSLGLDSCAAFDKRFTELKAKLRVKERKLRTIIAVANQTAAAFEGLKAKQASSVSAIRVLKATLHKKVNQTASELQGNTIIVTPPIKGSRYIKTIKNVPTSLQRATIKVTICHKFKFDFNN